MEKCQYFRVLNTTIMFNYAFTQKATCYLTFVIFLVQLGILNVIQAMELAPELAYPLYIAASVDWYVEVLMLLN